MSTTTKTETRSSGKLALNGGPKAVPGDHGDLFAWPIITREDEEAVLEVLRRRAMSGTDVTEKFEAEFAEWHGVKHALAHNNGTSAIHAALWACGVGVGDEVIAPSFTFWASVLQALNLGATVHFAEADPETLCIDPKDIEHRIGPRTKAILVVHYCGYPCDMDAILPIARKHKIKVIEDVSHAHGGRYKGRLVGTLGDVAGMSVMSGKALAIGEGGVLITDNREIFERAVAFGHYERTGRPSMYSDAKGQITDLELKKYAGVPLGGYKYRIQQLASAVGRVQLRHYKERMETIQRAMNRFWDLVEAQRLPGIRAHRPPKDSGSHCGGWYAAHGLYVPEELHGVPVAKFCEALRAEGVGSSPGANFPLHLHPVFHEADIYGHGKPTVLAHAERDVRQGPGDLPVTESLPDRCYGVPWFKHDKPEVIEQYAAAFGKVVRAIQDGTLR